MDKWVEPVTQVLDLENKFRDFYVLISNELELQKKLVGRLLVLSQRYSFLNRSEACDKYSSYAAAEDIIIHEYNNEYQKLHSSNKRIMESLSVLESSCKIRENISLKMDMYTEVSPTTDVLHKPIAHFIEVFDDLLKYFHAVALLYCYRSQSLSPSEFVQLEEYKNLLESPNNFQEYLTLKLSYCKFFK